MTRYAAAAGAATLAIAALAPAAWAGPVPTSLTPLPGSTFQGGDGDQDDADPPLPPEPGPGPAPPPGPAPLPGPPPRPIVPPLPTPPAAGSAGVAGVSATRRCVRRVAQVRLTGRRMHSFEVFLDGRRVSNRRLRLLQRRATPLDRVLSPGRHRLAVRVRFERGAATPAVTLRRTIAICAAPRPRVTG
jgi:hypothetical protein